MREERKDERKDNNLGSAFQDPPAGPGHSCGPHTGKHQTCILEM